MYKKFAIFLVISAIVVTGNYLSGSSPPPPKRLLSTLYSQVILYGVLP